MNRPHSARPVHAHRTAPIGTIRRTTSLRRSAAVLLIAALCPTLATAATFTVTTNNDFGPGSLRELINTANASPGVDTIVFGVTGVIQLGQRLPEVTDDLILQGPGGDIVTVSGASTVQILAIAPGATVSIADLTLAGGNANAGFGDGDRGGAVFNAGNLELAGVRLHDNSARYGGAIHNGAGASLVVGDSVLDDNFASTDGGSIHNAQGTVDLVDSAISGSQAQQFGGAIANVSIFPDPGGIGTVTLERSTLTGNRATFEGGAVYNDDQHIEVLDSTLSFNNVQGTGGAIATRGTDGRVRLVNSTLSGNYVDDGLSLGAGAINNADNQSEVILAHVTVANNSAPESAGIKGTFAARGSLFQNNGNNCAGFIGVPVNLGNNLATDGTCAGFAQVTPANLALGPLADNGGGTATHALGTGSFAIDTFPVCTDENAAIIPRDQRGVSRPVDGNGNGIAWCDTGAFEANQLDLLFADGFE